MLASWSKKLAKSSFYRSRAQCTCSRTTALGCSLRACKAARSADACGSPAARAANALPMAVACQQAVEFVGMPEGFIPLAETVVYLALARKSNSTYAAYHNAAKEVRDNGPQPVPLPLRNAATAMQRQWGYGHGYKYPHVFPDGWVNQDYLPDNLRGAEFYHPKEYGVEPRLTAWWQKHRQARPQGAANREIREKDRTQGDDDE